MGLFGKLLGKEGKNPPIDQSVPEYQTVQNFQKHLEKLSEQVDGDMEVLPCEDRAFVFIGNPPKKFGFAWVEEKFIYNLKGVAKEKGLSTAQFQKIAEDLREAYERNSEGLKKYSMNLSNTSITVTTSSNLGQDVKQIISQVG